jgi:hypothetical protein
MGRNDHDTLTEGSSMAGTYLYKSKSDAEDTARILGLHGSFQKTTPDGAFWMPGNNEDELKRRVFTGWSTPSQATVPQTTPLSFLSYIKQNKK